MTTLRLTGLLVILVTATPFCWTQRNQDCLACHREESLSQEKHGRQISLFVDENQLRKSAHGELECVSCHIGFKADELPHAARILPVDCSGCHDVQAHIHKNLGKKGATSCVDCHSGHSVQPISNMGTVERKRSASELCVRCHAAVAAQFRESSHGIALTSDIPGAPGCTDCHSEHGSDTLRSVAPLRDRRLEAQLCLSCHLDNPEVRSRVGPSAGFIASYEKSVHGRALKEGNDAAATCTDCHGSHDMKKGSDPSSRVWKQTIAHTCGTCHSSEEEQYQQSIHARSLSAGVMASATCTDCHGEHGILAPGDESSSVSARNISSQTCSSCHASVRLTSKYGIASDRFESFQDSYHGLAGRAGSIEVANCASCHGFHDIRPSSDPASSVNKANLVATCGKCHPGANENFTRGSVHQVTTASEDGILGMVRTAYLILIAIVIGGMFIHNVFDFVRAAKGKFGEKETITPTADSYRLYVRMTLNERLQHGILMLAFFTLVVTGFMLKFPDAWWVVPIREISPVVFEIRSTLHRIAGLLLIIGGLYHIYYILVVPRGKQLLRDLMPVRSDISDAINMVKFNVGLSREKPRLGRFSYIEKSEYWALIWGTVIMAATGLILWFENTFIGLLTKIGWDISEMIHYYEAWLATLAVIVWHLYYVIFSPRVYPMSRAWWKGVLTEEEMMDHHPLELEKINAAETARETEDKNLQQGDSSGQGEGSEKKPPN